MPLCLLGSVIVFFCAEFVYVSTLIVLNLAVKHNLKSLHRNGLLIADLTYFVHNL